MINVLSPIRVFSFTVALYSSALCPVCGITYPTIPVYVHQCISPSVFSTVYFHQCIFTSVFSPVYFHKCISHHQCISTSIFPPVYLPQCIYPNVFPSVYLPPSAYFPPPAHVMAPPCCLMFTKLKIQEKWPVVHCEFNLSKKLRKKLKFNLVTLARLEQRHIRKLNPKIAGKQRISMKTEDKTSLHFE